VDKRLVLGVERFHAHDTTPGSDARQVNGLFDFNVNKIEHLIVDFIESKNQ